MPLHVKILAFWLKIEIEMTVFERRSFLNFLKSNRRYLNYSILTNQKRLSNMLYQPLKNKWSWSRDLISFYSIEQQIIGSLFCFPKGGVLSSGQTRFCGMSNTKFRVYGLLLLFHRYHDVMYFICLDMSNSIQTITS